MGEQLSVIRLIVQASVPVQIVLGILAVFCVVAIIMRRKSKRLLSRARRSMSDSE